MKIKGHRYADPGPEEVIRLDDGANEAANGFADAAFMLVLFMRTVSGLWILRGLLHWNTILGSDLTPYEALPASIAAAVTFFAVIDLVAAVGMWLACAWGGVLWLFATIASIVVSLTLPEFHTGGRLMVAIDFALIVVYFVLSWYAARQRAD